MELAEPIRSFLTKVTESLDKQTFVRLVMSKPCQPEQEAERITGRLIDIRGQAHLSLTLHHATKDLTKNLPLQDVISWLGSTLGAQYRSALLNTTARDWQLSLESETQGRLISHKPAFKQVPARSHDQPKHALLDASARDWLQALEVLDASGKLRASMADKHRQINHYLEIFSHLARDCGWDKDNSGKLTIADMGCGKAYLTFGLWHLFARVWKQSVRVVGVEARPDLIQKTGSIAKAIGAHNLEFVQGTIQSARMDNLDGLIALHACNTATDDAILRGIQASATLIVVAPCCHKEVRPQLGKPEPLAPILSHGLMAERMAEWVTDGLRALFLEWAGYETKLLEFVSSEHTPKNLMIAAIRKHDPFTSETARKRIVDLKAYFGIHQHALDSLLEQKAEAKP